MKVVIIGGVAGGASSAARIRRLDENAEIVIFERSGYISYANCGLPYYIGGTISEKSELTLQTPESFYKRFRINVKVKHEVTDINIENKKVSVKNLTTGEEFTESYDKLVLAPGAKPVRPPISGIDGNRLFTLRTVEDTYQISEYIAENAERVRSALIVGGGFIGVEMAENLSERGISVTIAEMQRQLLSQFDTDMAGFIHSHIKSNGVRLMLGSSVSGFTETDTGVTVCFSDGTSICTDIVILALGVVPDTTLAKKAGLTLGLKGSIAVNEHMQTSSPDIYAVGDAVEINHMVTAQRTLVSLAGPANKQGRIAADNICGLNSVYKGALGTSVLKIFDLTAASVGINERTAIAAGIEYEKLIFSPLSHASYYPGGKVMTFKLIFEKKSARILGAQIVGFDGVDKRIDVIAAAMQCGMTAPELKELELSYAPPYSSAKDPVNMAGFIAENIISGLIKQIHYSDLEKLTKKQNVTLLDTRTDLEYSKGHAENFDTHIPVDSLRERIGELDPSKPVYVMCQSGLRSYIACRILSQHGFDCYNFSGGYRLYQSIHGEKQSASSVYPCGMERK